MAADEPEIIRPIYQLIDVIVLHLKNKLTFFSVKMIETNKDNSTLKFLPARRYASAGYSDRNVSVCLSVCLSVCHAPVLCQNEES